MKKKFYLLCMLTVIFLSGCGKTQIDLADYTKVTFDGVETRGTAQVQIDDEALLIAALGDAPDDSTKEVKYMQDAMFFTTAYDYDIAPAENLSNGDTVTLSYRINNDVLKDMKIELVGAEQKFTVEGLEEPKVVDVFDAAEVVFHGMDGEAYVTMKNTSDDAFLKTVRYSAEPNYDLSVGDTITIQATFRGEDAWNAGYLVDATEKQIKVEKLDEYLTTIEQLTLEQRQELLNKAEAWAETGCVLDSVYLMTHIEGVELSRSEKENHLFFVYKTPDGSGYHALDVNSIVVKADGMMDYKTSFNGGLVGYSFTAGTLEEVDAELYDSRYNTIKLTTEEYLK